MNSSLLVFGGSGRLGRALGRRAAARGVEARALSSADVDIRDAAAVSARVEAAARDGATAVVNFAAQANVGRAEREVELTHAVNADGAENVARAAAGAGLPLLHASTDYVFDGRTERPYREDDATGEPVGEYGRSKLLGEQRVLAAYPAALVARVAVLFGFGPDGDFVEWVSRRAGLVGADDEQIPASVQPLTIVEDRFISPTWADDCVDQLLVLLEHLAEVRARSAAEAAELAGVYHATGHGVTSWYDYARAIVELRGGDPDIVTPIADADLPSDAPRPRYSALDNARLRALGLDTMLTWRDGLARYLRSG